MFTTQYCFNLYQEHSIKKAPEKFSGALTKTYLFLGRIALSCFLRLCLAIFLRRFFLRLPMIELSLYYLVYKV